ncbi:MAG: DUF4281 domain-containing protein [Flavobacteriales bacterium]|nr:DUF4281 domain-containing protein [Flavobacteriales bacterium]
MNWGLVFKIANLSVIPGWLLLVFLPQSRVTKAFVHGYVYPVVLSMFYLFMLVTSFGGEGGMDTLQNLKASFQRDEVLILGWVHYLVFDLFIGAWITRDAHQNRIKHFAIVPLLVLTLFAGPVGLLSYLTIRAIQVKRFTL